MAKVVSAAHPKSHLSALMAEVAHGQRVIIERRGKPHVAMVPVRELERLGDEGGARPLGGIGLVGAWGALNDSQMDKMLIVVTRNRRHFDRVPGLRVENWID